MFNKISISYPPQNIGLLSAVTSCGLHTTSLNAGEGESSGETGKIIFFKYVKKKKKTSELHSVKKSLECNS